MKPFFRPDRANQAEAYTAEIRDKTGKLRDFVRSVAADYKSLYNLPIGEDGRLIPFSREDASASTEGLRKWHGDVADKTAIVKDSESENERLELLAHAVFWKNLKDKFIVARASRHDGDLNKVHMVLLERETGALVCAFDEVGDTSGDDYERKLEAVRKRNVDQGGTTLKYGLRVETKGSNKTVVPGTTEHVPLFYIALRQDKIIEGIREFIPLTTEQSEFEQKLFNYFIDVILLQISTLELDSDRMEPMLRDRLQGFKNTIKKFRSKPEKIGP